MNCQWCGTAFVPKTVTQIYCGPSCRTAASKQKASELDAQEKRRKRIGKDRVCAGGCGTKLSIYNDFQMCENCLENKTKMKSFLSDLKDFL